MRKEIASKLGEEESSFCTRNRQGKHGGYSEKFVCTFIRPKERGRVIGKREKRERGEPSLSAQSVVFITGLSVSLIPTPC